MDHDDTEHNHHSDDDGDDDEEEEHDDEFNDDMFVQPSNPRYKPIQHPPITSSSSTSAMPHRKKQNHQNSQGSNKGLSFISDFLDTVILNDDVKGGADDDDDGDPDVFDEEEGEGVVRRRHRDLLFISPTKDSQQRHYSNQEDGSISPAESSLSPTSLDYPLHTLPTTITPSQTLAILPSPTPVISSWGLQDNLLQKSDTKRLHITIEEITTRLTLARSRYWMNRWHHALRQSRSVTEMIAARNLNIKRKVHV